MKYFSVLLPRRFEVVRFPLVTLGFSLWALLLFQFHAFRNRQLNFRIDSLRIDD
jgi:hypothetical protein